MPSATPSGVAAAAAPLQQQDQLPRGSHSHAQHHAKQQENKANDGQQYARLPPAQAELVAGCIAGATNVVSGYPFDTLKVRLQASPGRYTGMTDCFRQLWRTEGLRGLFRGVSSPLVGGAAETGVNYMVYSRLLHAAKAPCDAQPPLWVVPLAGAAAGVALSCILAPTELLKVRSQMAQAASPLICLQQVMAQEGSRGLARGFGATLVREIPGNALFFTVYEGLHRQLAPRGHSHSSGAHVTRAELDAGEPGSRGNPQEATAASLLQKLAAAVFCGGMAGSVMWAAVLPLDVAKTRIQTAAPGSAWDVGVVAHLRMMWAAGGIAALWTGLTPTLVRAFPANAAQWLAWEGAIALLHNQHMD